VYTIEFPINTTCGRVRCIAASCLESKSASTGSGANRERSTTKAKANAADAVTTPKSKWRRRMAPDYGPITPAIQVIF
jgi:hypothetical protein